MEPHPMSHEMVLERSSPPMMDLLLVPKGGR
jgi:hypothetical protein